MINLRLRPLRLAATLLFLTSVIIQIMDCQKALYSSHVSIPTRVPCTEETDLSIVTAVTAKPSEMADKIGKELCILSFGLIIFASPNNPNMKYLLELINNSDLDGDQFVVIWEESILNCLKNKNMKPK